MTAWKSSKLRFLSTRRVLQTNTTNTSNTTNTTPAVVTYTYNLCPVQDMVCGSDTIGAAGNYAAYISSFIGTLNTAAGWLANTGVKNVPITGTPTTLSDLTIPTLNFTATPPNFTWTSTSPGVFNVTVYNPVQILCWWMEGFSNQTLTSNQIQTCNNTLVNCGNLTVTPTGASIVNTITTAPSWNTDVNIWVQCVNNIPMSTQFANVTSAFYWNTGNQPGTTPNNTANNSTNPNGSTNGSGNNTTKTNTTSGSYIAYGIALLISLVLIL